MENIKIGIVGIGNMGSAHLNCIYNGEIDGLKVTAVWEKNPMRIKAVKEEYSDIIVYDDYDKMLEKAYIDAVLISTPHPLHSQMGIQALKADKHLLVEKPIDITVSKAKMINDLAQESNKVFGIMFNQRTNNLFSIARDIVKSGQLGELKRSNWIITNWYRTQSYYDSGSWRATWGGEGGGVLLNQAPHQLDLWQWICGMPKSVTAFCNIAKYHNIEVEDEAIIHTTYENGATGSFITSTGEYPGTNRLEISGTLGKLVIEEGVLKHWKLKEDEHLVCKTSPLNSPEIEMEYTEYKAEYEPGHKGILQNFTNSIINNEPLIAPGIEGINELIISNAAYLSNWKGNVKINIPFDKEEFDSFLSINKDKSKFKGNFISNDNENNINYTSRWKVHW
ncbi:MAG: Gfo/Idh/MocA family oxidoreductase [Acutalibacteraceae bacterium]|nr:Gfo/Idh/MocA family oxidoreductase [Acutalibacteraceae bacterium]